MPNHDILAKKQGKITALDKNRGFHDFRVSMIFYCPY